MKKLIFIIISLFSMLAVCDQVSAKVTDSREIELRAKIMKNDPRSISPVRAWLDGRIVCVSFLGLPEEVTVSISDAAGNLVDTYHYQSPESVSIPIVKCTGTFKIEIKCDSIIFIGEFELK